MRSTSIVLTALSLGVAAYAVALYGFFPLSVALHPDMRATFESHRAGIYVHVFASAFALVLGPFQLSARLRGAFPALHRWCWVPNHFVADLLLRHRG